MSAEYPAFGRMPYWKALVDSSGSIGMVVCDEVSMGFGCI